ncbi:MAG: 3-deoxy-7-phosphoheptulonate synthase [Chloroflexi bacterium]|nr:3-deoxy-7-phosphoheptulonate synthase [Chloroflexota bacterium]
MVVIMQNNATKADLDAVLARVAEHNLRGSVTVGESQNIVGIIGTPITVALQESLESMSGVREVIRISRPYKLATREFHPLDTIVDVSGIKVGGGSAVVMAGPCAVESETQIMNTAIAVKKAGAHMLRGGAFKPRSSPYSFRGMGEEALKLMAKARTETGLPIVTEVMTPTDVALVAEYADLLQIGARNMQNYQLLEEVGRSQRPVLLKRGLSATFEEWMLSAEYIMNQGNHNIILCERGIRTFETATRNTLDLNAVALAKKRTHLPIIVDPSHGTGKWYLVQPLALAGLAAGADGLMIEVHPDPDKATSDGPQSLTLEHFAELMPKVNALAGILH